MIATANITKNSVSGSIAVSAAAAMILGETSEAMKSSTFGTSPTSCGLSARNALAPCGTGNARSSAGMAIEAKAPPASCTAIITASIRRAAVPTRAAMIICTSPSTSSAATSGMIVICKARSHSPPISDATSDTHCGAPHAAPAIPASSPPISAAKVSATGRRIDTSANLPCPDSPALSLSSNFESFKWAPRPSLCAITAPEARHNHADGELMTRKLFGTDGIRGRTNAGVMTAATAMKVGQAAGRHFVRGGHRHRVVIGKDTRLSGYMMESALVAGFTSVGIDVIMTGPLPTPAIALLTREMRADLGVMISASHNLFADNGIKLFGPDGFKLSDEAESEIERLMETDIPLAPAERIGRARRIEDARGRYIHAVKQSVAAEIRFDGLKVVVDCANGAAYQVAPSAIWELGAEVVALGVTPNGININDGVGSTAIAALQAKVVEEGADIGIALDGDADRLIVVDETGRAVDGDQIMALIATRMHEKGMLRGGGIVATVMSNLGLERYLAGLGLTLERAKVGDRYVLEAMKAGGYNIGGEQSGHMILLDHATTGDGTVAALRVLASLVRSGKKASELLHVFEPVPQLLKNVRYEGGKPLENANVQAVIAEAEAALAGKGRLVIRPSGTEPVIRVMAEGDDQAQVEQVVDAICEAVRAAV